MDLCFRIITMLIAFTFLSCASPGAQPLPREDSGKTVATRQIVVISDLHMGEGIDPKTKSWYPMEDFRWPDQFKQFLDHVDNEGGGKTDLVVNGDLFDLWQSAEIACQSDRGKDFGCTEEESLAHLQRVLRAHKSELAALGTFATKGDNRLIILPGNHDAALLFPKVKEAALQAIGGGQRVSFATSYWLSDDRLVYIEHGHQIGREVNKWDTWPEIFLKKNGQRYLERPWGERFLQDIFNRLESKYQLIDNIEPEGEAILYTMSAEGTGRTIEEAGDFMKWYFFGLSWRQFKGSLGKEQKGDPPEWDIEVIRKQGPCFLAESIPDDEPFFSDVRDCSQGKEQKQLVELFEKLSDEDIKSICDKRGSIVELQQWEMANGKRDKMSISSCPKTQGSLGAVMQSIFLSGKKVLGAHIGKVVCPNLEGCQKKPFKVFVFGHTHLALPPTELSLGEFYRPTIINSGAWQRIVSPEQLTAIRDRKGLSKKAVFPELFPEDLPPCYSFVLIKPYSADPVPLLRYWVGEERQKGAVSEGCSSGR